MSPFVYTLRISVYFRECDKIAIEKYNPLVTVYRYRLALYIQSLFVTHVFDDPVGSYYSRSSSMRRGVTMFGIYVVLGTTDFVSIFMQNLITDTKFIIVLSFYAFYVAFIPFFCFQSTFDFTFCSHFSYFSLYCYWKI